MSKIIEGSFSSSATWRDVEQSNRTRDQITPEGEAKFTYKGHKMTVHIENDSQLWRLSQHLQIDLKPYFQDYFGALNTVTPIIVSCEHKLSVSGIMEGSMFDNMAIMMGGESESFNSQKLRAMTLDAFMNPQNHPEYLI